MCVKQSNDRKSEVISLRLTPEMDKRLTTVARGLKMPKNSLAQAAIEAAVEAIEANGGKIVLPLEFTTTHAAVVKPLAPPVKTEPNLYTFPSDQGFKVADTPDQAASAS